MFWTKVSDLFRESRAHVLFRAICLGVNNIDVRVLRLGCFSVYIHMPISPIQIQRLDGHDYDIVTRDLG